VAKSNKRNNLLSFDKEPHQSVWFFYFCQMSENGPIGVFDSGYGGLTVLKEIVQQLPQYNYIYLGDNARAPYGSRSYQTVYQYTLQCVQWFFQQGCHLVILACNTASAKALRTIQQNDLERIAPGKRVLGVIRPTTEKIGGYTATGEVGVLGTSGTVQSGSYEIEIRKFNPEVKVYQQACPMWVPLIENNEFESEGADYFVAKYLDQLFSQSAGIDTVLLACTHYPLLAGKIQKLLPAGKQLVSQGKIVAEIEEKCTRGGSVQFYTTDSAEDFDSHASIFYGQQVKSAHVELK
jgi:glutamate racemase